MSYCGGIFDLEQKRLSIAQKKDKMSHDPNFWLDTQKSASLLKELKAAETFVEMVESLESVRDDLEVAIELATEDSGFIEEAWLVLARFDELIAHVEMTSFLSGPLDHHDAYLTIQAGAGGTESCDWAAILWRMYGRYADKKNWTCQVVAESVGEVAGIKSVACEISGSMVYGHLRQESGVHRLIRISPFDSGARRHTSFASVHVTALVNDDIEVEILAKDLRIDTYRASGAGGQHVNKTDSAVRITHHPTGIVVQSQAQRSQHQNREKCMQLLKAKLYEWQQQKIDQEKNADAAQKSSISFGSQIRTYTLHPFKLIKDHRSGYESTSPGAILDGDLAELIRSHFISSS